MKNSYKIAWKDPGVKVGFFSPVHRLKAVILRPLEKKRAALPVRSYKAPKSKFK